MTNQPACEKYDQSNLLKLVSSLMYQVHYAGSRNPTVFLRKLFINLILRIMKKIHLLTLGISILGALIFNVAMAASSPAPIPEEPETYFWHKKYCKGNSGPTYTECDSSGGPETCLASQWGQIKDNNCPPPE